MTKVFPLKPAFFHSCAHYTFFERSRDNCQEPNFNRQPKHFTLKSCAAAVRHVTFYLLAGSAERRCQTTGRWEVIIRSSVTPCSWCRCVNNHIIFDSSITHGLPVPSLLQPANVSVKNRNRRTAPYISHEGDANFWRCWHMGGVVILSTCRGRQKVWRMFM